MGHNHSSRAVQAAQAREAAREKRLAGWRWTGTRLEEINTAEGVLARGGALKGRCRTGECDRRVRVDLHAWVRHGFGEVGIAALEQSYRCARLACGLVFDAPFHADGIPVQCLVGGPDRIALKCRKCGVGKVYEPEALIATLNKAGTGDGNTGVNVLGSRVRGRCRACGYPGWISELVRPPRTGTSEAGQAPSG